MQKRRLTVTADVQPLSAGQRAVEAGEFGSLSEWANAAMAEKASRDRRLRLLRQALASYEAEYGEITEEEMGEQARADREAAITVRGPRRAVA
ncbi:MAG: hypothetical protein LBJ02_09105 [Bifidobacteriaceae bacterium]|jgi:Arc/MetJ-type ribon-helix-helix transcriptional regulator|nr:hypothetical protein [Bifidobacteriaceae bacterium]